MEPRHHGQLSCFTAQCLAWPNRTNLICPATSDRWPSWEQCIAHDALPLLSISGQIAPSCAHGFLPGLECAQVWLQLQGFIEVCLQQGIEFSGFSTDIEKIFNNVGRDSLMAHAEHIDISDSLLKPWRAFLDEFVRSFQIQTALSMPERGTQGLPWHLQFMLLPMLTTFLKPDMR